MDANREYISYLAAVSASRDYDKVIAAMLVVAMVAAIVQCFRENFQKRAIG